MTEARRVLFAVDPRGVPMWMVLLARTLERAGLEVVGWVARREVEPPSGPIAERLRRLRPHPGLPKPVPVSDLGGREHVEVPPTVDVVVCANHLPEVSRAEVWALGSTADPFEPPTRRDPAHPTTLHVCLWRLDGTPQVVEQIWTRRHPHLFARTMDEASPRWAEVVARGILGHSAPRRASSEPKSKPNLPRRALRRLRGLVQSPHARQQWSVAYQWGGAELQPDRLTHLIPPVDRLWADPFGFEVDGEMIVFVEEALHGEKGHIIAFRVRDADHWEPVGVVLQTPYHLSYPQVLEHDSQIWMIPESGALGELRAHRCLHFPDQWDPVGITLIRESLADATVWRGPERWWLWATTSGTGNPSDSLVLYSADEFEGPWHPHPENPVRVDIRRSRPAGAVWSNADGAIFRVAQDCAGRYGEAVIVQRVLSLTPYEDIDLKRISADRFHANCVHTLNRCGPLWLVDFEGLRPQ